MWQQHSNPNLLHHVVSIGDSSYEHEACRSIGGHGRYTKTIKLISQPTLEQLFHQLEAMQLHLPQVYKHNGSLDLHLVPSQHDPTHFQLLQYS